MAPVLRHRDDRGERAHGAHPPTRARHPASPRHDRWLDRDETERLPVELLRPYESEGMEVYEANPLVNSVRNNGPEMMRAAANATEHGELPI